MADTLLELHICLNLVHCHMTGAFYHYLYILSPCTFCQCAKLDKLGYLTCVRSVVDTSGTECVTETDSAVEFTKNVEHLIIILIEWVFIACHSHPCKKERAAARNDVHFSLITYKRFNRTFIYTGMDSHEINALFCVSTNDLEEVLSSYLKKILFKIADSIIHRNCTYHCRRLLNKCFTECVGLSVVTEIHDSLCAEFDRHIDLFHFHVIILHIAGNTKVYVDLCTHTCTDSLR